MAKAESWRMTLWKLKHCMWFGWTARVKPPVPILYEATQVQPIHFLWKLQRAWESKPHLAVLCYALAFKSTMPDTDKWERLGTNITVQAWPPDGMKGDVGKGLHSERQMGMWIKWHEEDALGHRHFLLLAGSVQGTWQDTCLVAYPLLFWHHQGWLHSTCLPCFLFFEGISPFFPFPSVFLYQGYIKYLFIHWVFLPVGW